MAVSARAQKVLDVFFPRLYMNPFKGLMDGNSKNRHSRALRTTWFTKMADTFKALNGDVNPIWLVKREWRMFKGGLKLNVEIDPFDLEQAKKSGFKSALEARRKYSQSYRGRKSGLLDLPANALLSPLIFSLDYMVGVVMSVVVAIPMLIGKGFQRLYRRENIVAKIFGAIFAAIFLSPVFLFLIAHEIARVAIGLSLLLVKAAASAVLTLVAMPIVSVVNFIAFLTSYQLFKSIKTLEFRTMEQPKGEFITDKERKSNTRQILSALHREDFRCEVVRNGGEESLHIYDKNTEVNQFRLYGSEIVQKADAFRALYKLNMFRLQEDVSLEVGVWLKSKGIDLDDLNPDVDDLLVPLLQQ